VRRRPTPEAIISGLAVLILVVVAAIAYNGSGASPVPYSSTSAAADGTLGLYLWLKSLGYRPQRLDSPLPPTNGPAALVVLEPYTGFTAAEAAGTQRWVRQGGTLILLRDQGNDALMSALHLRVALITGASSDTAVPMQPVLNRPPLRRLSVTVSAEMQGTAPGVVAVLSAAASDGSRRPVLVYEAVGRGRVYAASTPDILTNGRIARADNRRLALNALAGLPTGAVVGFDEYHLVAHTAASAQPVSLDEAILGTGWGRSLIAAALLAAAYIALTGRRMGRPVPAIPERGRSLAEYIVSTAALFRRAGLRDRVLALWQDDLRRALAGPGGVRGRDDEALIGEATRRAHLLAEEQREAAILLQPRVAVGEGALIDLCGRMARLRDRVTRR
jgi:hypothetical protein